MKKQSLYAGVLLALVAALPLSCKDESPCDAGQESIGTGCFPKAADDDGDGGAAGAGGGGGTSAPTFGSPCASDDDCGGDAPVCDTQMFHYCLQTDCLEGEVNAGVCPEGWQCIHVEPNPSACITF